MTIFFKTAQIILSQFCFTTWVVLDFSRNFNTENMNPDSIITTTNSVDATPLMSSSGADLAPMPLWAVILISLIYAVFYLGAPLTMIIAAKKNWSTKPSKTHVEEFTGFWRRVAIKLLDTLLALLIIPILFNVFFYFRDGQTIADKIFGTKIVDKKTHATASVGKLFIRFIAKFFSFLALGIGFFVAGWRKEKLAWHDGLADVRYVSYKKVHGAWTWAVILSPLVILFLVTNLISHAFLTA